MRVVHRRGLFALSLLALLMGGCSRSEDPEATTGAGTSPRSASPSVLLITVDTLRADRLGSYGYSLDTSPHMDALAASGVRFSNASVQWPKTWPSMASLMSGRYPHTNGMGLVRRVLPDSVVLLGELFQAAGYDSAAVVANFNVSRMFGFGQGFDHFVESWQEKWKEEEGSELFVNAPGRVKEYTNATLVTDQALRWIWSRAGSDRPFFLWLHYMDPHGPYLPPQKYAELFEGQHESAEIPLMLLPRYQRQRRAGRVVTDLAFYQAQYDREIRYLDDEIGRLLEQISRLDLGDLLTVLTADHGESMGEHRYYLGHGMLPYQASARVPLIVVGPGIGPPGRAIDTPVGLVDLSGTLLELAGLPVPETFEGTSLAAQLRGDPEGPLPRYVFMQSGANEERPQLAVRDGRWKLVHVRMHEERRAMSGAEFELYDLEADPHETENLASRHPGVVSRLGLVLDQWFGDGMSRDGPQGVGVEMPSVDVMLYDLQSCRLGS